ncbi:hypothetical protein XarbCFBP8138_02800 [Xanthomonas arboricola]|nr:hypothetical protein XarbCFBP8138_02800 [Xanthomonas arboricola]
MCEWRAAQVDRHGEIARAARFDRRTHAAADLRKQWRRCACSCSAGRAGGPPRMTLTKAYDD